MSTSQRMDTFGGGDTTWDDYGSYAGKIERNTYKLIEKKYILAVIHEEKNKWPIHPEDFGEVAVPYCPGGNFEKVLVYVVDAISKDPDYCYSKSRWYIDVNHWQIVYNDMFDRKGKLWKCIHQRLYICNEIRYSHTFEEIDMQAKHASIWEVYGYSENDNPKTIQFSVDALRTNVR